jgi:hypothetical protein
MTAALVMAVAIYVVVVASIVATVPWWHRAATLGLRLRRLRVELVDDILTGALPPAEPVTGLVAAVEHLSERHRRLRLLELLVRAARDRLVPDDARAAAAPVQPVPALAAVGAPVRVWAGLRCDETMRLEDYRARLDSLTAALVLTTSWTGLATVAWFMLTGPRSPRAAVAAADRAWIGQAARRAIPVPPHLTGPAAASSAVRP